jgi:hypothetical protein
MNEKRDERFLLSAAEARDPQNLLELFALLTGRRATEVEVAELVRESACRYDGARQESTIMEDDANERQDR